MIMKPTAAIDTGETGEPRRGEMKPVKILRFNPNLDIEKLKERIRKFTFEDKYDLRNYIVTYTDDNKIEHIKPFDKDE